MKFNQNLYYMECFCISIRSRGPSLGGLVLPFFGPKFLFRQKNRGHFFTFFGPKFGHFCSKVRFSNIFFKTAHQICLKLGQEPRTVALYHLMAVLCLGKFLFWPFWPFLGQKYIAYGDIIWFLAKK